MSDGKESKHRVPLFSADTAAVADRGRRFIYSILIHVKVDGFCIWRIRRMFTVIPCPGRSVSRHSIADRIDLFTQSSNPNQAQCRLLITLLEKHARFTQFAYPKDRFSTNTFFIGARSWIRIRICICICIFIRLTLKPTS